MSPTPLSRKSSVRPPSPGKTHPSPTSKNRKSSGLSRSKRTNVLVDKENAGLIQLLIAVGGIYGSFLTWAFLQERLTTTLHGSTASPEFFKFPVFLNSIQSLFAALVGYVYLRRSNGSKNSAPPPIFPQGSIILPLLLAATMSSLASPFGYASLAHIDYTTFILAKSCKLLPVMLLNITLFRKKYPLYKYIVILAVTSGVAVFTLDAAAPRKASKASSSPERSSTWGLVLLSVNLIFDGLTNTTQDYIFENFQPYSGPQMMCANSIISSVLTLCYLILSPYFAQSRFWELLGLASASNMNEFAGALAFLARYPRVWYDVIGFAACGAIGQVFIFYTLSTFSSILLVTITVTRKMLTMMLSVIWFGHKLAAAQWIGVGLVFGGIGAEGVMGRREKALKKKKN